ncbi:MAG: YraN family protein [Lachnospiraceae bacterium]|jgi:putative endonuclease
MTNNKRAIGKDYEEQACKYLVEAGMEILERNYRKRTGEIDIIARDGEYIVFIEVKFRSSTERGGAFYAISRKKKQTIDKVAMWFLCEREIPLNSLCRFDAVLIDGSEISHVKNAW